MASPAPDRAKAERIDRLLRKQIGRSGLHMILPALIACDVDGTLLGEDEKVTARTRDAVRAAIDAGVLFVLARRAGTPMPLAIAVKSSTGRDRSSKLRAATPAPDTARSSSRPRIA